MIKNSTYIPPDTSQGKSRSGSQIDGLVWAYPCPCTLWIGIHFLKDPDFRALVGLRDLFDDLCCVEGISIWSDRLRKARGSNEIGESIQKRQFFSIILVLVSEPFLTWWTVGISPTFCLCGPRRKGAQREEDCTMREARRSTSSFKYTT